MDRSKGIGGSDVGSIVGCRGAYGTPWKLWAEKTGHRAPDEPTEQMIMGHVLEPVIMSLYESRTGNKLLAGVVLPDGTGWDRRDTLTHALHPWANGHLDGVTMVNGLYYVVDGKNTQRHGLGDDEDLADVDAGECPEPWWLQLHHYAWILRAHGLLVADVAHVAALVNGSTYRTLVVSLDLEWYELDVVPQLAEFWDCVTDRREPPGLTVQPERKPLPYVETMGAARRYLEAAAREKAAEVEKKIAQAEVWAELDKHECPARALCDGAKLSVSRSEGRSSVDLGRLESDYPDAYAATVRRGQPSRSLRVMEPKK